MSSSIRAAERCRPPSVSREACRDGEGISEQELSALQASVAKLETLGDDALGGFKNALSAVFIAPIANSDDEFAQNLQRAKDGLESALDDGLVSSEEAADIHAALDKATEHLKAFRDTKETVGGVAGVVGAVASVLPISNLVLRGLAGAGAYTAVQAGVNGGDYSPAAAIRDLARGAVVGAAVKPVRDLGFVKGGLLGLGALTVAGGIKDLTHLEKAGWKELSELQQDREDGVFQTVTNQVGNEVERVDSRLAALDDAKRCEKPDA